MGISVLREENTRGERCARCGLESETGMVFDRNVGARCADYDSCDERRIDNQANGRKPNQPA